MSTSRLEDASIKRALIFLIMIFISTSITPKAFGEAHIDGNSSNISRKADNKAMGPLKVSSFNPRYFTDGTGKVVYLTGSHTWTNFQDRGEANISPFDYTAYLDFLQENNHNFIRLWVWEHAAWAPWTDKKILFDPLPYLRPGSGKALDGGLKFCLSKFNQTYFDRLRSRVIAAQERRIYVSVMLFQGFSVETKGMKPTNFPPGNLRKVISRLGLKVERLKKNNPWRGHPLR